MVATNSKTKKSTLFLLPETSYDVYPGTDGSDMLHIPTTSLSPLKDAMMTLETNYALGRMEPTAPISGADGWSLDFESLYYGLSAAAGDGAAPPAKDFQDYLFEHIICGAGSSVSKSGEGLASVTDANTIVLDTAAFAIQDLMAIFEAGIPAAGSRQRTQWVKATSLATATYDVTPDLVGSPTGAAIAYGSRQFIYTDVNEGSLSFAYVKPDGTVYLCSGGRITAASISAEAKQTVKMKFTVSGSTKSDATDALTALPAIGRISAKPLIATRSFIFLGGTSYPTSKIDFDFGISAAEVETTEGTNGRSGNISMMCSPKISIMPEFSSDYVELKRQRTEQEAIISYGAGVLAGGVLATSAIHCSAVVAAEADDQDASGLLRTAITLNAVDPGVLSGTTLKRFFQLARG